jgi:hypothetical protein
MRIRVFPAFIVILAGLCPIAPAQSTGGTETAIATIARIFLSPSYNTDWSGLEKLPGIKWAALPPTALQNCLPDGGCFARQGTAILGGKNLSVLATGARTIVTHLYLRNAGPAIGEASVLSAVKQAGFSAELARCPVPGTIGGTNWYRLKASGSEGYLAAQTSCNGKPCEGFTFTMGKDLPPLQANQLRLYSEQCSAGAATRKPVSTSSPQEELAQALASLIPPASGPAFYDWKTMESLLPKASWQPGPKSFSPPTSDEPFNHQRSAQLTLAQREFSLSAKGVQAQVKEVTVDEMPMHAKGEDVLGLLRSQGFDVRLARCGPIYTESINNWYAVTSPKTHPVMLKQSIRSEGKQAQDAYDLRLDNTLPKRDPRDRDPGVNGCR